LEFCSKHPCDKKGLNFSTENDISKSDIKYEEKSSDSMALKSEITYEEHDVNEDITNDYNIDDYDPYDDDNDQKIGDNDSKDDDYVPSLNHAIKIKIKRNKKANDKNDPDNIDRKKKNLKNKIKLAEKPKQPYVSKKTGKETKIRIQTYDGTGVIPDNKNIVLVVKCEFCEESFPTVYTASIHMDIEHPAMKEKFDEKYRIYNCDIVDCQKSYYTVKALHKHYRDKHGRNPKDLSKYAKRKRTRYICPSCDKKFRVKDNFEDHLEEHKAGMGTMLFKCDVCDKKFHYRSSVREHKKAHHSDGPDIGLCPYCGESVKSIYEMRRHKKRHEDSLKYRNKKAATPLTPKKCLYCDHESINIAFHMFKEHDHGAICCEICGKKCHGKALLDKHVERFHSTEKVSCKVCGREFTCPDNLYRHMRSQHNEQKRYKCPHCEKTFQEKQTLEGHLNMHLGLKPFKCQFCGQGYQNKSNLAAHLRKSCKLKQ